MERTILHVDMDAFYASVEQRDNPELQGQPVIVGGTRNRGVVAAASYEVRRFGVHSAMPTKEALRRCPNAICVRPRMSHYKAVSQQVFEIFHSFTPVVEGLSLDEAFLDVSKTLRLMGDGVTIAKKVKNKIRDETGLTASVGVGPNKLVAKIASDLEKPDGLVYVPHDRINEILDPLPANSLWGVGKTTAAALKRQDIHTMGELRQASDTVLRPIFGRFAQSMRNRAAGIDQREVTPGRTDKSISHEETFEQDTRDRAWLTARLMQLTEATCARLRKKNLAAGVVTLKIRDSRFVTQTRQQSFHPAGNDTQLIYSLAAKLLNRWLDENPESRLRLLGVGVTGLAKASQLSLFDGDQGVDETVDRITRRYGKGTLGRGRILGAKDQD